MPREVPRGSCQGYGLFRSLHIAVAAPGFCLYAVAAQVLHFDLVTSPLPGYHPAAHRLAEILLLWTVCWSIWGWYLHFVGTDRDDRVAARAVVLFPWVAGVGLGAYKLWWHARGPHVFGAMPLSGLVAVSAVLELVKGVAAALLLRLQIAAWRNSRLRATGTDQRCRG